jgi:hypothetical protein
VVLPLVLVLQLVLVLPLVVLMLRFALQILDVRKPAPTPPI